MARIKKFSFRVLLRKKKNYGHLQMELQTCRQYFNENITDFIQRVETCTTRLLQSARTLSTDDSELKGLFTTIELILLQTFITGVRPEFSLMLRAREPTSLSEAYDVALNEEKSIAFIKQQGHRTNPSGRHDIQKTNFHKTKILLQQVIHIFIASRKSPS